MAPDLWLPGVTRVQPTNQAPIRLPLQGAGHRLFTWHTFEAPYTLTAVAGARYTNSQNSTPTFCFNPVTGDLVQQIPANVGARTLKAAAPARHTNAFGTIHMQIEVIAYAARPWTLDLTAAGAASLVRLMNFLRSWGIPDQWAWTGVDRPAATYAEANRPGYRRAPDRSGHAFHSKWWANDHWDPGAIVAPWLIAPDVPVVKPPPPPPVEDPLRGFTPEHLAHVDRLLTDLDYQGDDVWAKTTAYQQDAGLTPDDGLPGPQTTKSLEDTMKKLDQLDQVASDVAFVREALMGKGYRDPFRENGARVPALNVVWANAHRGSEANGLLRQILATLAADQGLDPVAIGAAIADSIREDVVDAIATSGAAVTADALADEIGRRLSTTTIDQE